MYCKNCGDQIEDGSAFCINCGQSVSSEQAQKPTTSMPAKQKKKVNTLALILAAVSLLLAAALVIVLVIPGAPTKQTQSSAAADDDISEDAAEIMKGEEKAASDIADNSSIGFNTPEEAIKYFIDCINKGDVEGALAVSAMPYIVENLDFEAACERMGAIAPNTAMPTEYDFYRLYNENHYQGRLLRQINGLVLSLTQPEYASVAVSYDIFMLEDENVDYKGMDPTLKDQIKIIDINIPMPNKYYSEVNLEFMLAITEANNADAMDYRVVLYQYDGVYYAGGFVLLSFDGKWFIRDAKESLIGQSMSGALIPLDDKSDYDNLVE